MAAAMLYRGPDDDGFLLNDGRAPGLALGMRRLSIIDLKTGRQPVWNETRDVAGGMAPKKLSQDALTSYFLFGSVSEPVTLLDGVFSLPPGHRMLLYVPERRRMPRARAWWDATRSSAAKDARTTRDFASAAKRLRPLLQDAVRAHLIADVPVGLFLSSGLDSSAIAALAARERAGICSFTLSFPGTAYDEAPLARSIAKHCGTQHRQVPLGGDAVVSRLDEAASALVL